MKRLFYISAVMLSALALTSCSNEEASVENQESQEFTITATTASDTRTYVEMDENKMVTDASSSYYPVYWSEGDEIFIFGTEDGDCIGDYTVSGTFSLTSESGKTSGTFKGIMEGTGSTDDLQFALYPFTYPGVDSKTKKHTWYYDLPKSYIYTEEEKVGTNYPMYAIFDANDKTKLTFYHLCGIIRLRVKGFKANPENDATVTLLNEGFYIAGKAGVSLNTLSQRFEMAAPTTTYGGQSESITYTIPKEYITGPDKVFILDFPIPGSHDSTYTKVTIQSSESKTALIDEDWNLKEGRMRVVDLNFDEGNGLQASTTEDEFDTWY